MNSKQPIHISSGRKGSAMVATLVVVAVIAFSVAIMLSSVRHVSRATSDKIAFEECYQATMGGVQMAKAFLANENLADTLIEASAAAKFEALTSGSVDLSGAVILKLRADGDTAPAWTATDIVPYYSKYITPPGNNDLYGGRKLLWEWKGPGDNNRCIVFQNDLISTPTGSMFGATSDIRSAVTRIRFTTPFTENGVLASGEAYQKDDLRKVTLIVEAEGATYGQGITKHRMIRQKLLLVPVMESTGSSSSSPPLTPGNSIVSGGDVIISGSSHLDVYWGPVMVKGNTDLLDIDRLIPSKDGSNNNILTLALAQQSDKWHHAGFNTPSDSPDVGVDKWLKWWVSGILYSKQGSNRKEIIPRWTGSDLSTTEYDGGTALADGQSYVQDVFSQLQNVASAGISNNTFSGPLGSAWPYSSLRFPTGYDTSLGENVYYMPPNSSGIYPVGQGGLVQKNPNVATTVDAFMANDMSYTTWKAFAIAKNLYAKPGTGSKAGGFVSADNIPLYVKPDRTLAPIPTGSAIPTGYVRFTELRQVSMKSLVPGDGFTLGIPDQILFIDTAEGTSGGTPTNISLGSNDDFFWKGLFYLQGNLTVAGSGQAPTINMKNPEQYAEFLSDPATYRLNGYMIPRCFCDGIAFASGTMDRTGNSSVYGTAAAKGGFGTGGGPTIYYNSRNKGGLFQSSPATARPTGLANIIDGPMVEIGA